LNHFQDLVWILPFLLYAETHYRFKFFFSFLRKSEPEVIADAPHRIEPGTDIPLLILSKDADKFPSILSSVKVSYLQSGNVVRQIELIDTAVKLNERMWWRVYTLSREGINGWLELDVQLTIVTSGKTKTYHSDNHRTSTHAPLRAYLSDEPLPRFSGLNFGDAHTHSDRTDDQVEFGVPPGAAVELSKFIGLSFFCIADHSYDLDDSVDDYTTNDPAFPKWKSLLGEIERINAAHSDFAVLSGEEVSCRNLSGRNVHCLLFGDERFFPGSGDGAEDWLRTGSEHSILDILSQKHERALAFAAHPMDRVSILQRLLLNRGSWSTNDLSDSRLAGIQFANGITNYGYTNGYKAWIQRLLKGQRIYCLAGNDAHGNFNRFRQIGIPFFSIRESGSQLFGKMRTAVFLRSKFGQSAILHSLSEGRFIVTDGPVANIVIKGGETSDTSIGGRLVGSDFEVLITSASSREFGQIKRVSVFVGVIGEPAERLFVSECVSGIFSYLKTFSLRVTEPMYMRAEVYSSAENASDKTQHFCFTNPVWLMPLAHP